MKITVCCASIKGKVFIEKLANLSNKNDQITVISFREDPWESPYFEDIKAFSKVQDFDFYESKNLASTKLKHLWEEENAIDLMFTVGWRFMIPESIYSAPKKGTVCFHDSLLPKYRGFAPLNWAIINGEEETGATVFYLSKDVDKGPIIAQQKLAIEKSDNIESLLNRMNEVYISLLENVYEQFQSTEIKVQDQDESQATYCCKRTPEDGRILWNQSSEQIYNLVRAISHPFPGAYCFVNGEKILVWKATLPTSPKNYVGKVVGRIISFGEDDSVEILTGDSSIIINEVQLEGGNIVPAKLLLNKISSKIS